MHYNPELQVGATRFAAVNDTRAPEATTTTTYCTPPLDHSTGSASRNVSLADSISEWSDVGRRPNPDRYPRFTDRPANK